MSDEQLLRIEEQAAAFVARMDAEEWSQADETEFQQWLQLDVRHRGIFLQTHAAWIALDSRDEMMPMSPESDVEPEAEEIGRTPFGRRAVLLGGGGALAAAAAGVFLLGRGTSYSTELGEIRRVPLADGSSAAINSASQLTVVLSEKRRDVRLVKGEAWFRVAKDASRPFVVEAGSVLVRAVGTAFSVRRRADGAEVIVSEGVVEGWAAGADGHRVRLEAGQRAFIGNNSAISVKEDTVAGADRALAWREGFIDLAGVSVQNAIEDFNRYNGRKLVLDDPALGGEQVDGIFRTDDPLGFARAVGRIFDASVIDTDPATIRIGPKEK
ncbi:FecR domain-containing protein [Sphingobium sp. BHU LFT2]|uniref:FecR family protein n=1 Tax=Sphingobium sp. BHU LFT2 TaxID=2807634 RepID=UPI001BECDD54|nr:FecR domain-containing protein [Sphingobium sp. BHU LFT2]MBT2246981.1 FecR domain-containing protein [Sphingobium sp. BHU LFT2]